MRKNLKIWKPELCNISDDAVIGDDVIIHPMTNIYADVKIGDRCKIQAGVFIPNGITIGNDVFVAPGVFMANDKYPPSNHQGWEKTFIEDEVSIGIGSIIMPGITIGRGSIIGAGSLVTKNIPEGEIWMGSPAKYFKEIIDL